jgi:hypothetical protein
MEEYGTKEKIVDALFIIAMAPLFYVFVVGVFLL